MSPKESSFDWVKASWECSLPNEFVKLENEAKGNVGKRQYLLAAESPIGFAFNKISQDHFEVSRSPTGEAYGLKHEVIFCLRHDHILIQDNFGGRKFVLTLILNDDGECRFKIDGEGDKEFLIWQVMRRALDGLFFQIKT